MNLKKRHSTLSSPLARSLRALLLFGLVLSGCRPKIDAARAICAEGYIDTKTTGVPTLVLTLETYCKYYDCPDSIARFESGWETCAQEEHDYSACDYYRHVGCGEHIYEEFSDESWYGWIWFDSETGELLGMAMGSDTAVFCEQTAGSILVGETHSYRECKEREAIETTRCCSYGSLDE